MRYTERFMKRYLVGGASPGGRRRGCTASLRRNCATARMKSESISAAMRLTFAPSSTQKAASARKTAAFAPQSARRHTGAAEYSLLPTEEIVAQAQRCAQQSVARDLIVTSGKRLPEEEVERMREAVGAMRARAGIAVCVSFGLLRRDQYRQ